MTQDDDATTRFSALYRAYYPLILRTCVRRLGGRQAGEDAAQEVFRIALQHYPKEDLSVAWLYATARNVVGNEYRRLARSTAALARLEQPTAGQPSTDALDVRAAMTRLRESDRELLYMTYWEDLAAQEIGSILGISAAAVWVRLTRAREALRELLLGPIPVRSWRRRG